MFADNIYRNIIYVCTYMYMVKSILCKLRDALRGKYRELS